MKKNLIPFPKYHQMNHNKKKLLTQTDELVALRAKFHRACVEWPLEMAELPENNKISNGSKK